MITLTNILKKSFSLCVVCALFCLFWSSQAVATSSASCGGGQSSWKAGGECTVNPPYASYRPKSAGKYISQSANSCLSSIPLAAGSNPVINTAPGCRKGPNGNYHEGLDVSVPAGTYITAPADGIIAGISWGCKAQGDAGSGEGAGNYIVMQHQINPNKVAARENKSCKYYYSVFYHLSQKANGVSVGAKYKKGAAIAKVGGTNCSGGRLVNGYSPHMHYELRLCNRKGAIQNPLCPSNKAFCDNTTPIDVSADSNFSGGPGSNNGVYVPPVDEVDCCTVASKACQQEVKNADKCVACKDKNKAHQECEKRNEAIRTGGVYCAPTGGGSGSSSVSSSSGGGTCGSVSKNIDGKTISPEMQQWINQAAQAAGVSPLFYTALLNVESGLCTNPLVRQRKANSCDARGCAQIIGSTWRGYVRQGRCSGDSFNNRDSILCGAQVLKDAIATAKADKNAPAGDYMRRAIAGYNAGPYCSKKGAGVQCRTKKYGANWESHMPQETKNYLQKMDDYMSKLAKQNGCSLGSLGGWGSVSGGGNCEDFGAMAGMDGMQGMMDFQSNYKCNYSENYSSLKGCIFCDLFRIIFNTASEVARKCHETLSSSLITLLAIGLAIWLAMLIMKYVSDWTVKDPGMLLNDIFRKTFIVCVIILLLKLNVTEFFNLFVTPVFRTGYNLGILVMDSTPGVTLPQETWDINGSGLPSEMGLSMLQGIYAVQSRLEQLMALGSHTICIAFYVKSFHGYPIFPHFGYLLTGVFLWLIAIVFMVVYPFLLLDSVLQFTIASSLFPAALAATAFKITKDKLNIFKIINIFINAMFVFIFLTIILFILLAGMDEAVLSKIKGAVETADAGSYFDLKEYGWFTVAFAKLVFFLFLGKAVLEDIPSFAERFGSAISFGEKYSPLPSGKGSIGRSLGGLFAGAATGMATQGAMPLAKGAVKGAFRATKNISGGFGSSLKSGVRSFRIARTQNQAASLATGSGIGAAAGTPTANGQAWVESRNWLRFGQKEMRRVSYDADGQAVLETQRRSLFKKTKTLTKSSEDFEMILKQARNGEMQESYKFRKGDIGSLINADGTRNEEACNRLMRTSGLSADELNKVRLNQMLKERMPNAKGANLEGKFVSEQIVNSKDAQGRDVFEVRRVDKDGKVHVFKMTKGQKRDLIEYETIGKDGKATKLSSDGILQKKESYQYELDAAGRPVLNEDGSYKIKDNSRRVQFSHAKAFKGVKFFDDDGFLERGARDLEFMMSPEDLALYKRQMKRYGDTLQHRAFDK